MCRILVSEEVKEGLKQWCKPVLRVCKKIVSIFQDIILGEQRIGFGCWNRGEVIYIHFPFMIVMVEVKIEVPEDIKFIAEVDKVELSLFVSRVVREELERLAWLSRELEKSKLTEEKAKEIADEINTSLARKYIELYGRR